MNAHRQDMVNVELTVAELRVLVEEEIVRKYPFLAESNGWDLQDMNFHDKNLNSAHQDADGWSGATYFFVKDIEVNDAPPLKEKCGCEVMLGGLDGLCSTCPNKGLKPCR